MTILKRAAASTLAVLLLSATAPVYAQYAPPQGPPPGYGPGGGWDAPPQDLGSDIMRRGFHDGIEGARKDYENHRQPNVNNRDEYRHPNLPGGLRHDYRIAFRRGYDVGVRHMMEGR